VRPGPPRERRAGTADLDSTSRVANLTHWRNPQRGAAHQECRSLFLTCESGGGRPLFCFLSIKTFQQLRIKFAPKNLGGDVNSHKKEGNSNYAGSTNLSGY
jgi:hypothetical protein